MKKIMYACPCCEKTVFYEEHKYEICPNCGWEDDPIQFNNSFFAGGANYFSLEDYRKFVLTGLNKEQIREMEEKKKQENMDVRIKFEQYKNLLISKAQLNDACGVNLHLCNVTNPISINKNDVIFVLTQYLSKGITKQELVDWVNIIWFNDVYDLNDIESDSIASVFSVIETMDEQDSDVSASDIENMISALQKNKEYQ